MNFSVGITVLRQYERLNYCLEAILNSTVRPDQILIIDNGGKLGRCDGAIVITPPTNLGVAASWNLLLRLIHPDTAIITQDDCVVLPDTFENLLTPEGPALVNALGWACFRQDSAITDVVGVYDERFYPAYYEDADFEVRMRQCGARRIDLGSIVKSHGNNGEHPYQLFSPQELEKFNELVNKNRELFIYKWGGLPSEVGFKR